MSREETRTRVVQLLGRKRIVGGHKKQVETVKNWFPTDEHGTTEAVIREMIRNPKAPLEGYGGSRDNVRLTSIEDAKRYIVERGGELPWRLRDE